jgi:hypothetical protein
VGLGTNPDGNIEAARTPCSLAVSQAQHCIHGGSHGSGRILCSGTRELGAQDSVGALGLAQTRLRSRSRESSHSDPSGRLHPPGLLDRKLSGFDTYV